MNIDEALTAYILAQPGITALIDRRLYPDDLPEGTRYPAVTCRDISDVKNHAIDGQIKNENPVRQFTVYADTKPEAMAAGAQIEAALNDYTGVMGEIPVQKITLLNALSSTYVSTDGLVKKNTRYLEYQIHFERS